jgi:VanZ family protein
MTDWLRRLLKNPRIWQFALAGFWLALFVSTHLPSNLPILPKSGVDKVVHFTAFAILASLLAMTWQLSAGHLTARHLVVVWIVLVVYAALDELTQIPVGRECSIWDWTADALGVALALVLFARLRSKFTAL